MGNVDPTLPRSQTALAEAYRLAGLEVPQHLGSVATHKTMSVDPTVHYEPHNARQALQESMDLREQGHADD